MPRYELRFNIPERQLGDSAPYKAFGRTVERLLRLRGHVADGARVEEVHVTGGSLFGSAMISTDNYQSALALVCRETPIIQLQWHLEEEVSPELTAELLEDAIVDHELGEHEHAGATPELNDRVQRLVDDVANDDFSMACLDLAQLHRSLAPHGSNGSGHGIEESGTVVPEMGGNDFRQDWLQFFN